MQSNVVVHTAAISVCEKAEQWQVALVLLESTLCLAEQVMSTQLSQFIILNVTQSMHMISDIYIYIYYIL